MFLLLPRLYLHCKIVTKVFFITTTMLALCFAYCTLALAKQNTAIPKSPNELDFSFFRLGTEGGPVMLVIGGIQGDEPGGFSAATLIATRYTVKKGTIWVVPNLNFPSIIRRSRGVHGDMNRKFAILPTSDPQFQTVNRIQEMIRSPEVNLVLNLHDGSGFYRHKYEDALHNPKRWGQSVIIDQSLMPNTPVSHNGTTGVSSLQYLERIATTVSDAVNKHLLDKGHRLHVHNTHTAKGDKEMEKSLSWYAVRHGKPAFGLEASKEFSVPGRTFYHLLMVEAFAKAAGIEIERDFPLTLKGVRNALASHLSVSFIQSRITLPLEDVRNRINFLPLPKNNYSPITSKPIMAVLPKGNQLAVHYGNRTLTNIHPQWMDIDTSIDSMPVLIDGQEKNIAFGHIIQVKNTFKVLPKHGYRVNAIGADTGKSNESNILLSKKSFIKTYSVDKGGHIYRIEVYKGKKFCGMFLVRFERTAT